MKIGVTISTFNRPDFLDITLWHWNKYSNSNTEIFVVDDGSIINKKEENENICKRYSKVNLTYQENQGISKTKTKGLSLTKYCDYVFLSDDDCFPIKENYENIFIDSYINSKNHHFMLLIDQINGHNIHGSKKLVFNNIESYDNCGGMLLFATRECINSVGGFDNRMKFYGYEHAQWSLKIHSKGFTSLGKYLCPINASEYFFTIDFDKGWKGLIPEYWNDNIIMTSSISTTEDKKNTYMDSINYNSQFVNDFNFYTEI